MGVLRLADLAGCAVVRRDSLEATARGLAWLTADRPAHWGGAPTGRTFSPRHDLPLAARFDAWRQHMADALS